MLRDFVMHFLKTFAYLFYIINNLIKIFNFNYILSLQKKYLLRILVFKINSSNSLNFGLFFFIYCDFLK